MQYCRIPYNEAEPLIQEGDFLLFRNRSFFSFFIRDATKSRYSHISMASWLYDENGNKAMLEAVEFKEFKGGRTVSLREYVNTTKAQIDVFRIQQLHEWNSFDCNKKEVETYFLNFGGRRVTNEIRKYTSAPYGWIRIWNIILNYIPLYYTFFGNDEDDKNMCTKFRPSVCSTIIANALASQYVDIFPFKNNDFVSPGMFSQNPLLTYLFTLEKDKETA